MICVRSVKLSRKPQIIFFTIVPTLDNSEQILHHTAPTIKKSNPPLPERCFIWDIFGKMPFT